MSHTPNDPTIHERFEAQARATPQRIAVIAGDGQLTYAQLNERANQLAHDLRGRGIGPDRLVGLHVERQLHVMVAILAILKAGGAYVPLDPAYPEARLRHMVADSGLTVVLSQAALAEGATQLAEAFDVEVICLDDATFGTAVAQHSLSDPCRTADQGGHNLAYVIYTSGSTGAPKGVMIEHRGALNLARDQQAMLGVDGDSRVLAFASFSFDAAVWEWLIALLGGATLCLCDGPTRRDPAALEAYLLDQRITHALLPPALLVHLSPERPYFLQALVVGGEACSMAQVQPWLARTRVFNAYGPTEATVIASAVQLRADEPVTIGRALDNVQLYVLDEARRIVPDGEPGELYIGGIGVARGYLNRLALTAERFIADPFDAAGGGRLYRSGDLVRVLGDGKLAFMGRIDDQVKVRGYRIELGEIEALLMRHPAVGSAAVVARDARLIAYVTPAGEAFPPEPGALQAYLGAQLPDYMVPAALMVLDALPLTPNGKIDKRALPAPPAPAPLAAGDAPSTPTERELAAIWAQLLQVDAASVGRGANFFTLGGHSLSAVQLSKIIRERFGKPLRPDELFADAGLAALARRIDSRDAAADGAIPAAAAQTTYAASSKQKMDWLSNQICQSKGFASLVCQLTLDIEDADLAVLEQALQLMVERHEILRTALRPVDGALRQVICAQLPAPLLGHVHDLRGAPDEHAAFATIAHGESLVLFDFAAPRLFSACVVRTRRADTLVFTVDHVCGDKQSFDVLLRELRQVYDDLLAGSTPQLPPLRLDYKSYAQWEDEHLEGSSAAAHRRYWHELVGPGPYPCYSSSFADRTPSVIQSYRAAMEAQLAALGPGLDPLFYTEVYGNVVNAYPAPQHSARYLFPIDGELFATLQAASARCGVWLSCVVIAGLHILLHKLSGEERVMMGVVAEGRIVDELAEVGGCLINDIFSVSRIRQDTACTDLMARLQEQMIASSAHKIYPFARLLDELDVALDALGLIELNYISMAGDAAMPSLTAQHQPGGFGAMDVNIAMTAYRDGIHVECNYKCALFESATIAAVMQYYVAILRQLARDPAQPVAHLPSRPILPTP